MTADLLADLDNGECRCSGVYAVWCDCEDECCASRSPEGGATDA